MPFYRVYRCADDRFVAVGPLEPKFYRELLDVTGLDGEIDPDDQYRSASWPETIEKFEQRFATRTRDEWARAAEGRDACLSPVLDFAEAAQDPHNLANELYRNEPFAQPDQTIRFE